MPNDVYDVARVQLLTAQLNWQTIPLVLTAWSGTPNFDPTHETIAQIVADGGVELGHSMTITEQSVATDGTAQTNEVLIPDVPVGVEVTWFTMSWLNATNYQNSSLILFIDDAEGLPYDPNGLDMLVTPDWLDNQGWWRP